MHFSPACPVSWSLMMCPVASSDHAHPNTHQTAPFGQDAEQLADQSHAGMNGFLGGQPVASISGSSMPKRCCRWDARQHL